MTISHGENAHDSGLPTLDAEAYASEQALVDDIIQSMEVSGACIIRNLIKKHVVGKMIQEISPYIEDLGKCCFYDKRTSVIPGLVGKSETFATEVVDHDVWVKVRTHFLTHRFGPYWAGDQQVEHYSSPQLGSSASLRVGPGAQAQSLHRDDSIHHGWNGPATKYEVGRDVCCGFFTACTKTHRNNGATRVVPGSHLWDFAKPPPTDGAGVVDAELDPGDCLMIVGSVYHGHGENTTTDEYRLLTSCGAPGHACWPQQANWQRLNGTIGGNLMSLRPAGSVCFGTNHSVAECEDMVENFRNTSWRVQNPASLQVVNWENWRHGKQSCYRPPDGKVSKCDQGRVAVFSAYVQSVRQVQEVVKFAAANDLRLTIRNTGHDLAGRSSAPHSLQIHTAGLKEVHFTESFHPITPFGQEAESQGPAVTIGAGVLTGELYSAAAERGHTVVGGSCSTVGIAGGWMQGGGYGILSPTQGLGVDNVLEFSMVTAEGAYVTANPFQNEDLFWAVRGGGGGTFGVVTSVTFRTIPDVTATVAKLNVVSPNGTHDRFWSAVKQHISILPSLIDRGIAVQTFAIPVFPPGGSLLAIEVYLINQTDGTGFAIVQEHYHLLQKLGLDVTYSEEHFDQLSRYLALPKGLDQAGVGIMTASRLMSRDLMVSSGAPAKIAHMLSELHLQPGDVISLEGMLGGQVIANANRADSALHPDWRSALLSLTIGRALPVEPDWESYQKVEDELRHRQLPLLESVDNPRTSGYLGIPFPYESNPAETFWGRNYDQLLEIKRRWDPKDLFITRLGVGSERWDDEGICRIRPRSASLSTLLSATMSWLRRLLSSSLSRFASWN
ncbi:hypothetical protein CDV55_106611 [Aspergillus turcosus]|nr:hypothetical protein CDV55_106611 [Aspergillus turcosus]